jgi:hypothetical protein
MNKYSLLIISIYFITTILSGKVVAQNYRITEISTDIVGISGSDFSVFYEKTKLDTNKFGVSIGYMIGCKWLATFVSSPINDADYLPLYAYNGPQLRIYYMLSLNKKHKNNYLGIELFSKYGYYKNTKFDGVPEGDMSFEYTRDEKAYIYGLKFLFCKDYFSEKVFSQIFCGLGVRYKSRFINTTDYTDDFGGHSMPLGKDHYTYFSPSIEFGVKIGHYKRK